MLLSSVIWLQQTGVMRALRESDRGYEILLSLHVSMIALFGATVVMTNLRLLGIGPAGYSVAEIVDQLRVPKRIGLLCIGTCGFLLFGMKAEEYYLNAFFRLKVALFLLVAVHAMIFRPRVYNAAAALDDDAGRRGSPPARAKSAAATSLLLWLGIVCAGRGIGYIHPPPFSHHFSKLWKRPAQAGEFLITRFDKAGCNRTPFYTTPFNATMFNPQKGGRNAD